MVEWLEQFIGQDLSELFISFLASRAFIVSLILFGMWMFFGRIIGRIKDVIVGTLKSIVAILSPLKAKRIFFNFVSLIFLVGGASSAGGAGAKVAGYDDSTWWAFATGGASLAIYALIMLVFNNVEYLREERRRREKKENK